MKNLQHIAKHLAKEHGELTEAVSHKDAMIGEQETEVKMLEKWFLNFCDGEKIDHADICCGSPIISVLQMANGTIVFVLPKVLYD